MRPCSTFAVLAGLLAMAGCTVSRPVAAEVTQPPSGPPAAILDTSVPGWETSAWLASGALCVRANRTGEAAKRHPEGDIVSCDRVSSDLESGGGPMLAGKPLPNVAPMDPRQEKLILVGAVRGEIATVSVTMFGETATATVHPLAATGGNQVGAYAVWLPRSAPGKPGMNLSDITAVVGYTAIGAVVDRI